MEAMASKKPLKFQEFWDRMDLATSQIESAWPEWKRKPVVTRTPLDRHSSERELDHTTATNR